MKMVCGPVHRRTGGLETDEELYYGRPEVHRRTGGLEILPQPKAQIDWVHRRTGGLETHTMAACV